jgi:hypothetical protein
MVDWGICYTEAIGIHNPCACTIVTKPDSMSEEDFQVIDFDRFYRTAAR